MGNCEFHASAGGIRLDRVQRSSWCERLASHPETPSDLLFKQIFAGGVVRGAPQGTIDGRPLALIVYSLLVSHAYGDRNESSRADKAPSFPSREDIGSLEPEPITQLVYS
jgi:hypothetical protein